MKVKFDFRELDDFRKRLSSNKKLSSHWKEATRELADVLKEMIKNNTPVKTGKLKRGWDAQGGKASYTIRVSKNGYSISLYNRVEYAEAVNYGHHSYNQFGGPWIVNDENRTVEYTRGESGATFVYGHFFIERSIEELQRNPDLVYKIIGDELGKWWGWCVNGK